MLQAGGKYDSKGILTRISVDFMNWTVEYITESLHPGLEALAPIDVWAGNVSSEDSPAGNTETNEASSKQGNNVCQTLRC